MATAAYQITRALYLNGAAAPINPASPELKQIAFETLIDMLVEWAALDINLGITIPVNQTDELVNPPDTNQVIQYQLAIRTAPFFKLTAPMSVMGEAARLYDALLTTYAPHPLPEWPDTLPVGQGNMRGTKSRVFMPTSSGLTDSSGIPLVGGSGS